MNELERLQQVRNAIGDFSGRVLKSVTVGVVPRSSKGKELLLGDQQFVELEFGRGEKVRLETRSGFKDEGGFFVVAQ